MGINYIGFIFFIVLLLTGVFSKRIRIIDVFVFAIPFNSTEVFNLGGTPVGLPLTLFFASASITFYKLLMLRNIKISKYLFYSSLLLILVGIVAILSEIMPFIINGKYKVLDRYGAMVYYAKEIPLVPNMQWITQLLYFLIGILVVFSVQFNYNTKDKINSGIKYLLHGITFMIFWGWFEYFCFFTNIISYPYQIFDHIGMTSIKGTLELSNFPRMTSTTLEPSYLAQILTPATPFFYFYLNTKKINFKYYISIFTLLVANTTTGLLGAFFCLYFFLKNKTEKMSKRTKIFLYSFILVFSIIILYIGILILMEKSKDYSGTERLKTLVLGFKYFFDYPILGIGFGVFPTFDFFVLILVNLGIVGTTFFLIYLFMVYYRLDYFNKKYTTETIFKAAMQSMVLLILVSELSGFIYHSQYFYVYLGFYFTISANYNKTI